MVSQACVPLVSSVKTVIGILQLLSEGFDGWECWICSYDLTFQAEPSNLNIYRDFNCLLRRPDVSFCKLCPEGTCLF